MSRWLKATGDARLARRPYGQQLLRLAAIIHRIAVAADISGGKIVAYAIEFAGNGAVACPRHRGHAPLDGEYADDDPVQGTCRFAHGNLRRRA